MKIAIEPSGVLDVKPHFILQSDEAKIIVIDPNFASEEAELKFVVSQSKH